MDSETTTNKAPPSSSGSGLRSNPNLSQQTNNKRQRPDSDPSQLLNQLTIFRNF